MMKRRRRGVCRGAWMCLICAPGLTTQASSADGPSVTFDRPPHAKGITVLRATFPSRGEVWRINLNTSQDGKEFHEAGIGLLGRPDVLTSVADHQGTTTILVPAAGWFGTYISFFGEPGPHWFRWDISFRDQDKPRTAPDQLDRSIEPISVEQMINVKAARREDLDFIAGLGDPDLMRAMVGGEFFDQRMDDADEYFTDREMRAVAVIAQLLLATREDWVGDVIRQAGPRGDVHKAAEMLLALAQELPESSYAPYAAYYAACCYSQNCLVEAREAVRVRRAQGGFTSDLAEGTYRAELLKNNPHSARAYEGFTLSAQKADDYLKPRVLNQHGALRLMSLDLDQAERLLLEAERVAPDERMIQKWTAKMRGGIDEIRAELEKGKSQLDNIEDR